jgi:hypothetical protein
MIMRMIEKIDEDFVNSQPKLIQEILILYLQINNGYRNCKSSFEIWKFMMTHDIERLNKRCNGLNAFDEFYSGLGSGWRGI